MERGRQRAPRRSESRDRRLAAIRESTRASVATGGVQHDRRVETQPRIPQDDARNHPSQSGISARTQPPFVGPNSSSTFAAVSPFIEQEEIQPSLGLQNTRRSYPFMTTDRFLDAPNAIAELIPRHADIMKYACYELGGA